MDIGFVSLIHLPSIHQRDHGGVGTVGRSFIAAIIRQLLLLFTCRVDLMERLLLLAVVVMIPFRNFPSQFVVEQMIARHLIEDWQFQEKSFRIVSSHFQISDWILEKIK